MASSVWTPAGASGGGLLLVELGDLSRCLALGLVPGRTP